MGVLPRVREAVRRARHGVPRFSLRSRTVLVLIPLHVVAFVALYLGMLRVLRVEALRTHSVDARILLSVAVRDLHPYMCTSEREKIPEQVRRFAAQHALLDLHVFRRNAVPMSKPGGPDPKIRSFLGGADADTFAFSEEAGRVTLDGLMRVRAVGSCIECHNPGEQLGAAAMRLDLTQEIQGAQAHLQRNIAFLVAGWTLVFGLLNIGLTSWIRRSLARWHGDLHDSGTAAGGPRGGISRALLDPVAAEIYESLRRLIHERQRREETVTDRLHHTDRLASLGQLAAGLAHEIKNPLAGVRGVIELLRDDTEDDKRKDLYTQIMSELDRVNGTIHSLLHFARPSPPNRRETDVADLLERSVQLLRPSLAQRSVALTVEVARDVGTFPLDGAQIRQVVTNLVTNAAEALQRDGTVVVRASRFPQGSGIIIAVHDDGPGISEDVRSKLFEPFFTTKFSGTGLGLAVVRSLVHQHGGRVEVQSDLGRGSTFLVLLPAPEEQPEHAGPPAAAEES